MKIKLNLAQKEFLFGTIFNGNLQEIYKIFDTCSVNWLKKQKIVLSSPDQFGWVPLLMNGTHYTSLNFDMYGSLGWNEIWDLK